MSELLFSKKAKMPFLLLFSSVISVLITLAFIYWDYKLLLSLLNTFPQRAEIISFILLSLILTDFTAIAGGYVFANYLTVSNTYLKIYDDHIEGKMRLRTKRTFFTGRDCKSIKFNQPKDNCEIFYFKGKLWVKYDDITGYLKYSIYDADKILTVLDK